MMTTTARYQIIHHDVNPIWRKTFILEIGRPFPGNIIASKWFMIGGNHPSGRNANGLSGTASWGGGMILKLKWWLWDCGKGELPNPSESQKWQFVAAVCVGSLITSVLWSVAWIIKWVPV